MFVPKLTVFILAVLALLPTAFEASAGVGLQPHAATYEFKLTAARSGGSVTDASGRMTFELNDACKAWTSDQRTTLELGFASGGRLLVGWSNTTYEAKDGSSFRFFVEQYSTSGEEEKQSGRARLSSDGSGGTAEIEEGKEAREQMLPRGTLFPSAFTAKLIEAARSGEVLLSGPLFDGSGDKGVYDVSLIIGKPIPAGALVPFEALDGLESWQVRAAFYSLGGTASLPDQEQSFRLFENGVIDRLKLDMGDFEVEGTLINYEVPPEGAC